jgi:hypothetical protein
MKWSVVQKPVSKTFKSLSTLKCIQHTYNTYLKYYFKYFKIKPDTDNIFHHASIVNILTYYHRLYASTCCKYVTPINNKHHTLDNSSAVNGILWLHSKFIEVIGVCFFSGFKFQAVIKIRDYKQWNPLKTNLPSLFVYTHKVDSA